MIKEIFFAILLLIAVIAGWYYYQLPPLEPSPHAPAQTQTTPLVFDVVRVEADGATVIAGRSKPFAVVSLIDGKKVIVSERASGRGEWVIILEKLSPLNAPHSLRLKATNRDGSEQHSEQIVTIGAIGKAAPIIVLTQPDKPSQILQSHGATSQGGELFLELIDYDDRGTAIFSGRAIVGHQIRLYWNDHFIGQARAKENEKWQIKVKGLKIKKAIIQLHLMNEANKLVTQISLPFQRAMLETLQKGQLRIKAGDNLWTIAHNLYGKGQNYTLIYQQNKLRIKNPDLIYPGQVFKKPQQ